MMKVYYIILNIHSLACPHLQAARTFTLSFLESYQAADLGIPVIAIFPATDPSKKSEGAEEALNAENLVCRR